MSQTWDERIAKLVQSEIFPSVLHRILCFGISRAGKSSLGEKLFPGNFERIPFHREMSVDDLIGGMILRNGTTEWSDGPALRALRHGKLVIFDEINDKSPEITSYLHALLDDPAAITTPVGERVLAAPGYGVIATTNSLPEELPLPIRDRFDVIIKVTELSSGLVKSLGPFANHAKSAALNQAKKYASWQRPASINLWIAASKLRKKGMNDEAIADALGLHDQEKKDFLIAIAPTSR